MTATRPEAAAAATAAPGPGAGRMLGLASAVTFLAFLDATVVNVAFPDLGRAFPEVSLARLTWVVSAYAVLFAALLAAAGRLADTLGRAPCSSDPPSPSPSPRSPPARPPPPTC